MENQSLLMKINSKYVIEVISSYINGDDFILKLIKHSKSLQKKLDIGLIDYRYKYLEKRENIEDCLYDFDLIEDLLSNSFYKDKYDQKSIIEVILFHLKKKSKQKANSEVFDDKNFIDLEFSNRLFNLIVELKIFDNILNINVNLEDLQSEITSNFEKMNKLNTKYPSLFFEFKDMNNINYIKDFKIEFNQIKRLSFYERYNDNEYDNIDIYFKTITSFDNIMNNLVYFSLIFYQKRKISKDIFQKINEFKSLNHLGLEEIEVSESFLLKLSNLKALALLSCKNINLIDNTNNDNNILTKLKKLSISHCIMSKPEPNCRLKCPEVEFLHLESLKEEKNLIGYSLIIDFSSLKKVKYYNGDSINFKFLENNKTLEEVSLFDYEHTEEMEEKNLKTICLIKSLKNIDFQLEKIYDSDISNIADINKSVKTMKIELDYNSRSNYLYAIQNKFPNLENIHIITHDHIFGGNAELEIEENPECKIKDIKIDLRHYYVVGIFCAPFDKLQSVEIICEERRCDYSNLINAFPIFNNKCDVIFKSLNSFKFEGVDFINKNIVDNIFNNISNMPNLVNFKLMCKIKEEIGEDSYNNFIIKVLSLKFIRRINISICRDKENKMYSKEEIIKLCPNINLDHLYNINIQKLN